MATGASPREIATELVVPLETVQSREQHFLGKLGIHSRAAAIVIAQNSATGAPAGPARERPRGAQGQQPPDVLGRRGYHVGIAPALRLTSDIGLPPSVYRSLPRSSATAPAPWPASSPAPRNACPPWAPSSGTTGASGRPANSTHRSAA
jgi:Bacterial regulatory proteins, luxR family